MSGNKYMPTSEGKFLEWSDNLITVSTANATEWKLPQDKLAELRPLHNEAKRRNYPPRRNTGNTPA